MEIEQRLQQKMDKAVEDVQHQAAEEKQKILLDATKQMRDTIREMNAQSSSKEVSGGVGLRLGSSSKEVSCRSFLGYFVSFITITLSQVVIISC